jgi:hypothetical protein
METGGVSPNGTKNHNLWTFSLRKNGWSLLGELNKIVNVSPQRFDFIVYQAASFSFGVHGMPEETVTVWVIDPKDNIIILNVIIPESGHTYITL